MSCRTRPFTYVGESKRCWKSRGAENKPGANGNIGSAVKQHAKTSGHDIHPKYVNILETGVKIKNKRFFLESLQSFLDKNSVNERAPFPRVYASLVSSLRSNENDVFFYIFAFGDSLSTFLWRRPQKAAGNVMLRLVVVLFQFVFSSNHSHSHSHKATSLAKS